MKAFTIIKVGYSAGIYGCSNEFFTCIYTTKEGLKSFHFKGKYRADSMVRQAMIDKGFSESCVQSRFGKLTGDDRKHAETWSHCDSMAVKFVNDGFPSVMEI